MSTDPKDKTEKNENVIAPDAEGIKLASLDNVPTEDIDFGSEWSAILNDTSTHIILADGGK